ncbi:MAG: DUF445 family protein [Treponema sp.]|nr:DUF445 family protein [Treponema sp.]
MTGHLFWILPPLVGGLIGYVTNLVAIKMLFRPLREIRLFGLRLPFTPGILPRERRKLAQSIGDMVERELVTAGVIRERLAKSEVRGNIGAAIGSYTNHVLSRPVSSWLEDQHGDTWNSHIAELSKDFVNSEVFNSFLEEIIRAWAQRKFPSIKIPFLERDDDGFSSWLKSRMHDVGSAFISPAREIIKGGLVREMKKHDRGEPSLYRQALENTLEKYPGITLREFLSLAETKKAKLDSFLAEKAASTLDENIEGALSSVNIKELVCDRINSLDMIRVEKIILDVMAGQLKWINFFGGVLGAMIGFFQVILWLFLR